MKSEIFTQMDGMPSTLHSGGLMMVLATTNCPWDLDEALRRRLEKRIYIPLPDAAARRTMFNLYLRDVKVASGDEDGGERGQQMMEGGGVQGESAAAIPRGASQVAAAEQQSQRLAKLGGGSGSVPNPLTMAQAASKMKEELGLAEDLNASDAVLAGAELLGVTFDAVDERGKPLTLKARVAVLCREAGIELGWDAPTQQAAAAAAAAAPPPPPPVAPPVPAGDDDEPGGAEEDAAALAHLVRIALLSCTTFLCNSNSHLPSQARDKYIRKLWGTGGGVRRYPSLENFRMGTQEQTSRCSAGTLRWRLCGVR
jgi:hypothetical protein